MVKNEFDWTCCCERCQDSPEIVRILEKMPGFAKSCRTETPILTIYQPNRLMGHEAESGSRLRNGSRSANIVRVSEVRHADAGAFASA